MSSVQATFQSESSISKQDGSLWHADDELKIQTSNQHSLSWFQQLAQRKMLNWLGDLRGGVVRFSDPTINHLYGHASDGALRADWSVNDPTFYRLLATGGSLGVAESYLQGHWETDNLTTLLRILCRNLQRMPSGTSLLSSFVQAFERLRVRIDGNTRAGSRRHIAEHYDLSNDFFELFLDPTMMYSSAWFEDSTVSLHEASIAKLKRICCKLDLRPSDQVLEIGTGWGGFSLHAAENYDCQVTTTTISDAQLAMVRQRIASAGVADRVQLLDSDYRDLSGQYDKLVSIEMVEAVGERYLDTFFRQCGRLLKPGGRCVLQAIVMPEQRYESYRKSMDYVRRYIFPGGFLPSVTAMQDSVGRTSDLRLEAVDDMSAHYAETLKHWRMRFLDRVDAVSRLGFDDRFIRMWEYYLCYCEAAFRERAVGVVQIVWDKPKC